MKTYSFRDEWQAPASPERVWALISEPTLYPKWWPIYLDARLLVDTGGVGSVATLKFRVLLPYTLTITTTSTRFEAPHLLEGSVSGELEGTWRWMLQPNEGGTRVVFEETVTTNRWILDLLAPIASRLFELNHRIAAERGAKGMLAYLAADAVSVTRSSSSTGWTG
jgi:uncharacterized protein YndB with AHSA1/START domain